MYPNGDALDLNMLMYYIDLITVTKDLIKEKRYDQAISELNKMYNVMENFSNFEYVDFYLDYSGRKISLKYFV